MWASDCVRSERGCRGALVTGANRGIGLAVVDLLARTGHRVILGSRDVERGMDASKQLREAGLTVRVAELDVENPRSIDACARDLEAERVEVSVLVNNAGVLFVNEDVRGPLAVRDDVVRRTFEANFFGPWRVSRAFVGGMVQRGYGRVVNVSSLCGSLTAGVPIKTCGPAYSSSKAALNYLTRALAATAYGHGDIKINSVCPGYVASDMGLATSGDPTMLLSEAALP